jgi:hypothetical protein
MSQYFTRKSKNETSERAPEAGPAPPIADDEIDFVAEDDSLAVFEANQPPPQM